MNPLIIAIGLAVVIGVCIFFWFKPKTPKTPSTKNTGTVLSMEYQPFTLAKKEQVSHDTFYFTFEFDPNKRLGLPVGKHILLKFEDEVKKEPVSRAYTPISSDEDMGRFELVIKVYPEGRMTQHLKELQPSQTIAVRGPLGNLEYKGNSIFSIKRKQPNGTSETVLKTVKNVGMIAGGTGITPMYQLIREICRKYPKDQTKCSLIFANKTEEDILLRDQLEEATKDYSSIFRLFYTLDRPGPKWTQGSGFVSADMIRTHLPPPSDDCLILICGPPPMVNFMQRHMDTLGYRSDMYFTY